MDMHHFRTGNAFALGGKIFRRQDDMFYTQSLVQSWGSGQKGKIMQVDLGHGFRVMNRVLILNYRWSGFSKHVLTMKNHALVNNASIMMPFITIIHYQPLSIIINQYLTSIAHSFTIYKPF